MRKTFNSSDEYYSYMSIKRMVKNGVRYGNVWNLWKIPIGTMLLLKKH